MRKIMKARKGGFTLVELLIVIIIIAILAGMMLLTTGAATDGAEASKLVNNLRSLKSASLLYYIDNGLEWPNGSALTATGQALATSLEKYMDRSIDTGKYIPNIIAFSSGANEGRALIGISGGTIWTDKPGIKAKLKGMAQDSGLYLADGASKYDGSATAVYMNMK